MVLALVSVGRDVLGPTVYDAIRAYHVIRLFLLVSYVTTLLMALSEVVLRGRVIEPSRADIGEPAHLVRRLT